MKNWTNLLCVTELMDCIHIKVLFESSSVTYVVENEGLKNVYSVTIDYEDAIRIYVNNLQVDLAKQLIIENGFGKYLVV